MKGTWFSHWLKIVIGVLCCLTTHSVNAGNTGPHIGTTPLQSRPVEIDPSKAEADPNHSLKNGNDHKYAFVGNKGPGDVHKGQLTKRATLNNVSIPEGAKPLEAEAPIPPAHKEQGPEGEVVNKLVEPVVDEEQATGDHGSRGEYVNIPAETGEAHPRIPVSNKTQDTTGEMVDKAGQSDQSVSPIDTNEMAVHQIAKGKTTANATGQAETQTTDNKEVYNQGGMDPFLTKKTAKEDTEPTSSRNGTKNENPAMQAAMRTLTQHFNETHIEHNSTGCSYRVFFALPCDPKTSEQQLHLILTSGGSYCTLFKQLAKDCQMPENEEERGVVMIPEHSKFSPLLRDITKRDRKHIELFLGELMMAGEDLPEAITTDEGRINFIEQMVKQLATFDQGNNWLEEKGGAKSDVVMSNGTVIGSNETEVLHSSNSITSEVKNNGSEVNQGVSQPRGSQNMFIGGYRGGEMPLSQKEIENLPRDLQDEVRQKEIQSGASKNMPFIGGFRGGDKPLNQNEVDNLPKELQSGKSVEDDLPTSENLLKDERVLRILQQLINGDKEKDVKKTDVKPGRVVDLLQRMNKRSDNQHMPMGVYDVSPAATGAKASSQGNKSPGWKSPDWKTPGSMAAAKAGPESGKPKVNGYKASLPSERPIANGLEKPQETKPKNWEFLSNPDPNAHVGGVPNQAIPAQPLHAKTATNGLHPVSVTPKEELQSSKSVMVEELPSHAGSFSSQAIPDKQMRPVASSKLAKTDLHPADGHDLHANITKVVELAYRAGRSVGFEAGLKKGQEDCQKSSTHDDDDDDSNDDVMDILKYLMTSKVKHDVDGDGDPKVPGVPGATKKANWYLTNMPNGKQRILIFQ